MVVRANEARIAAASDVPGADAMPLLFVRSGQWVGPRLTQQLVRRAADERDGPVAHAVPPR